MYAILFNNYHTSSDVYKNEHIGYDIYYLIEYIFSNTIY